MATVRAPTAFRPFLQPHFYEGVAFPKAGPVPPTQSRNSYSEGIATTDSLGCGGRIGGVTNHAALRRSNTVDPLPQQPVLLLTQERVKVLSRHQQRWFPCVFSDDVPKERIPAPMPFRHATAPESAASHTRPASVPEDRPASPTVTLVDVDAACSELRSILGKPKFRSSSDSSSVRSSSSSSQNTFVSASPSGSVADSPSPHAGLPITHTDYAVCDSDYYCANTRSASPHVLLEIVVPTSPICRCDNPAPRDDALSMSVYLDGAASTDVIRDYSVSYATKPLSAKSN